MKLIDKSALVAEIEKRIKEHHSGYLVCLKDILSFLDTLEVKEADSKDVSIEKACDAYCKVCGHYPRGKLTHICRQECDYFKDFQIYIKGK